MANYWKLREIIQQRRLYDLSEADLIKLLRKEYLRIYKDISGELAKLIASLPPDATADMIFKEDRLYRILSDMESKLTELGNFEKEKMTDSFRDFYLNNYQSVLSGEASTNILVDENRITRAITANWAGDGLNFSDRIWKNKRLLIEKLKTGLVDTVTTGRNWQTLSKEIQKTFGVSFSQAERLVRTELTHIQTQSTIDKYKDEGVEQVRYIAEPNCCEHCREHNNKIFDIGKAPIIPLHPFVGAPIFQ